MVEGNIGGGEPFRAHFFGFGGFTFPGFGNKNVAVVMKRWIIAHVKVEMSNVMQMSGCDIDLFLAFANGGCSCLLAWLKFAAYAIPFAGAKTAFLHSEQNAVVFAQKQER